MGNGDTPDVDRKTDPELGEPAAEPHAAPDHGTHNIIAELRNSMAVVARAGRPRRVRISTYGGYGFTRFVIFLFGLLGYLVLLAGVVALIFALGSLLTERANQITIGSFTTMVRSLNDIIATRIFLSLATIWAGLFTVVAGRAARATVDRADYARQALRLQKALAEGASEIDARRRSDKPAAETSPEI